MKLKHYLNFLNKIVEENNTLLESEVIYFKDEDGERFVPTTLPDFGFYDPKYNEFYHESDEVEVEELEKKNRVLVKCICL